MGRESGIVRRIMQALKARGVVVRKRHGSAFGMAGDPDLYGVTTARCPHCGDTITGQHFEIEVKRPGEGPRPLQEHRIAEWRQAGAVAGVACSPAEALGILGIPDGGNDAATKYRNTVE